MQQELLTNILDLIYEADGKRLTSDEIRDTFGIKETTTGNFNTRKLIKDAMRELAPICGVPVGADARGYFLIKTEQEMLEYIHNLIARVDGIQERINLVMKAWTRSKETE